MTKKIVENVPVQESTEYENFIGKVNEEDKPLSLADFLEMDDTQDEADDKEWKKNWVGMPEFEQKDNKTYKTIYVHFRNEEDYQEFAKLIGQKLTNKTKSIWHPELDRTKNSLLRWMEEE
jgi:hypothetical protein